MNITEKIQQLRKKKGWSIARLARESGIPTVSLRAMLNRKDPNSWNVKSLSKIAKSLGVSVSYLTLNDADGNKPKISILERDKLIAEFKNMLNNFFDVEGEHSEN